MKSSLQKVSQLLGAHTPARYIKGIFWVVLARIMSMVVSLVTVFYIARTLGPQNFGELSYSISVITLLAFFGAIASSSVICRDLVKNPADQHKIIGTSWILATLGTLTSLFCVFILVAILPHDNLTLQVIAILAVAQLLTPFQVTQNVFFATVNTKYISIGQLVIHLCVSGLKVLAVVSGQGVLVLAVILVIEQILAAVINLTLYIRFSKHNPVHWRLDTTYAKQLFSDSIPFVLITMSATVAARIDQVFIKHFIDTAAVGIYSVAVQFTEIWQVLPQTFLAVLLPAIVNAHSTKTFYKRRIFTIILLIITYSVSISIFITLFAPYIVPLIYGQAFVASIPLLQIYTWSLLGTVVGFVITNVLVTENQRRIQVAVGVIPMALNVLLNLLLIPTYGTVGAAWATVVSFSCAPLIPFFFIDIRRKFLTR